VVCFAASGSYSVAITGGASAEHVYATYGAQVSLVSTTPQLVFVERITMQPTARVELRGCIYLYGSTGALTVVVDGVLRLQTDTSVCSGAEFQIDTLINNGLLQLDNATVDPGIAGTFLDNRGIIQVDRRSRIDMGTAGANLEAGSLVGPGRLELSAYWANTATVRWSGTILPSRDAVTGQALLFIFGGSELVLADTALRGAVDLLGTGPEPVPVRGDIGALVDIGVVANHVRLEAAGVAFPGGSVANHGTLGFHLPNAVATIEAPQLVNHGTIVAGDSARSWLEVVGLVNRGTLRTSGSLTLQSAAEAVAPVRNDGTITVLPAGQLTVENADLEVVPSGHINGQVNAGWNARIVGSGVIESLVLDWDARLSPGIGTGSTDVLTIDSLTVAPGSTVELDVTGSSPMTSDRLQIGKYLSLAGKLALRTQPAAAAGRCGQLVTPFTMSRGASVIGTFTNYLGLDLGPGRAWRFVPGTTSHVLAGYDPTVLLSVDPRTLAVAEGGAPASTSLCLGGPAPTADVTVTPTARRGQVALSPTSLTFTTANWALPKTLAVTAIDDARAEGMHVDSVAFAMASSALPYRGTAIRQLHTDLSDNDPAVDLVLTPVALDSSAVVNAQLDARFRVSNIGPGPSTGSTFTITPMAGLEFVSNNGGVTCTPAAGIVSCTVGALAVGGSSEFTLLFRATAAGVHGNTARIAGRDHDADTSNNAYTWVVTIS
jgi:hypothetical protein